MFSVEIDRKALDGWKVGISKRFRRNLESAQGEIRQEWQAELYRQSDTQGDGTWAPLGKVYAARKQKQFEAGKIPFNSMLRRTGQMLAGYVNNITFFTTNSKVAVVMYYPYQDAKVLQRALENQGEVENPFVPARPFNIEAFQTIAFNRFNEAMQKSSEQ